MLARQVLNYLSYIPGHRVFPMADSSTKKSREECILVSVINLGNKKFWLLCPALRRKRNMGKKSGSQRDSAPQSRLLRAQRASNDSGHLRNSKGDRVNEPGTMDGHEKYHIMA